MAPGQVPSLDLGDGTRLRLVAQYKHLGCLVASSRSFERELTHRIAAGKVASASLGRRLFANRHLPDAAVSCASTACVASRVLFGAELWPRLSAKQAQRVEAALLQLLRRCYVHSASQLAIRAPLARGGAAAVRRACTTVSP